MIWGIEMELSWKRDSRALFYPLSHVWKDPEGAEYELGKQGLSKHQISEHVDLEFPNFWNKKKKFGFYKHLCFQIFITAAQTD